MTRKRSFQYLFGISALALMFAAGRTSAQPDVVGYFPANGGGNGLGYFHVTSDVNPSASYLFEFRRQDSPTTIIHTAVANRSLPLPATPLGPLGFSTTFALPRADLINFPTSFEIDLQCRVRSYAGANATETNLNNTSYLLVAHPSTDVKTAPAFTALPLTAGAEAVDVTDSRATGNRTRYSYRLVQKFVSAGQSQIDSFDHGVVGPFQTSFVHGTVVRSRTPVLAAGNQIFFVQSRGRFKDSNAVDLGSFDISHKSPNTASLKVN